MKLYIFIAIAVIYVASLFLLKKEAVRRLWFLLFVATFAIFAFGIFAMSFWNQELLATISNMGWFSLTYVFAILMVFLGVINAWMFKKTIWEIITGKKIPSEDCMPETTIDKEMKKVIDEYK